MKSLTFGSLDQRKVPMNTPCSWRGIVLLIALTSAVGCGNRVAPQPKYSIVGFRTATDNFAVSGGHLVVQPSKLA